jgi:hypothetical protein
MHWSQAALWGLVGGMSVEALNLYRQIHATPGRKWSWRCPIPQGMAAYIVSVIIRALVGGGVAAASAASDQLSGPLGAFTFGVAAPLILEKLAQLMLVQAPQAVDADGVVDTPPPLLPADSFQQPESALGTPAGDAHAS